MSVSLLPQATASRETQSAEWGVVLATVGVEDFVVATWTALRPRTMAAEAARVLVDALQPKFVEGHLLLSLTHDEPYSTQDACDDPCQQMLSRVLL
jgi:hypothetical protein